MLKDLVTANRSYRRYDQSAPVSRETLVRLADLARLTASSQNKQPFKFFLSCDEKTNSTIFAQLKWARLLKDWDGPASGEQPAAYFIILADTSILPAPSSVDVGIIAQTVTLGAVEEGLVGCMVANFVRADLAKALNLPENLVPHLVISLGKPGETVVLEPVKDESTDYYRDSQSRHHVPKRSLEEVVLGGI